MSFVGDFDVDGWFQVSATSFLIVQTSLLIGEAVEVEMVAILVEAVSEFEGVSSLWLIQSGGRKLKILGGVRETGGVRLATGEIDFSGDLEMNKFVFCLNELLMPL